MGCGEQGRRGGLAMIKVVRLFQREGFHRDSAEDAIAYAALLAESKARES